MSTATRTRTTGAPRRRAGTIALGLAATLALTGVAPTAAGAGPLPEPPPAPPGATLTVAPDAVVAGEDFTLTATGCTADGVPQDELEVVWVFDWDMYGGTLPTDAEGTASVTGTADASHAPELRLGASCLQTSLPEQEQLLFRYETVILTVTERPPAPSSAPAPVPVPVQPRFTG